MKNAVVFGAGNIGRGFIGQLLCESGYKVCFVDLDEALVSALSARGSYKLQTVMDGERRDYVVGPVMALHAKRDAEAVARSVAEADLLATAVGANALKFLVPNLLAGFELRAGKPGSAPLDVLLCENLHDAAAVFRETLSNAASPELREWMDAKLGCVDAVIGRMVPAPTPEMRAEDVSFIRTEPYKELPVDKAAFKNGVPEIAGLLPREPFGVFSARKLYLHNCGHAAMAYLGLLRGMKRPIDALADPIVAAALKGALEEAARGIDAKFGCGMAWLEKHVSELIARFGNEALGDTLLRLGRSPLRKLQPDDRLVGAARLAEAAGIRPCNLAMAIAAALHFQADDDPEARELAAALANKEGLPSALKRICGIDPDEDLGRTVLEAYARLKPKKAVVAGHICLDIIPEIGHELDLRPGALLEVGSAKLSTGGAVSNTGLAMRILGQPVELVGKVGDDAFGEAVARVLESYGEGLGRGLRVGRDASTSYSIVVNIPGRDRIFLHCPGANDQFDADCVEEAVLAGADLLHFGYPPIMARMRENGGASLESLFRRAKAEGAGVSLDMAMPDPAGPSGRVDWRAVLKRTLPFVDVFLPSADELLYALDRERFGKGETLSPSEAARLCDELIEMGAGVAGLKLGARGLYIRTASEERLRRAGRAAPSRPENWAKRELWFPTYKVSRFAGATGAGDATIGAFLCALLRGEAIEDAGRFANAVGACNVEAPDAVGGLLDWSSTWRRLRTGWAINDLAIGEPGWSFDAALGVWRGPADSLVAESV